MCSESSVCFIYKQLLLFGYFTLTRRWYPNDSSDSKEKLSCLSSSVLNYLLIVPRPAWQPPSPIKPLWKLGSKPLNGEAEDTRQVTISAKIFLRPNFLPSSSFLHLCFVTLQPPPLFHIARHGGYLLNIWIHKSHFAWGTLSSINNLLLNQDPWRI